MATKKKLIKTLRKDITGLQAGKLKVTSEYDKRNSRVYWKCLCECGNITWVSTSKLLNGHTTSCGKGNCRYPFKDLTGRTFNRLTVIKRVSKGKYRLWECNCECGNVSYVSTNSLINGDTKACGCLQKDHMRSVATKQVGPKNPRYNSALSVEEREHRRITPEYREWRMNVLRAYLFTCTICGAKRNLCTHHIDGYATQKTKRLDVMNGAVFCKKCHINFHVKYGYRDGATFLNFIEFFAENVIWPSKPLEASAA